MTMSKGGWELSVSGQTNVSETFQTPGSGCLVHSFCTSVSLTFVGWHAPFNHGFRKTNRNLCDWLNNIILMGGELN